MKYSIRSTNFELTEAIREYAERRCNFALTRFSIALSSVRLTMTDENGPKGGSDKRCTLMLRLVRGGELFVDARGDDLYAVIDALVDRAKRTLGRYLEKRHEVSVRNRRSA